MIQLVCSDFICRVSQAIGDCVFGILNEQDIHRIGQVDSQLVQILQQNLRSIFLEALRDQIPLLWCVDSLLPSTCCVSGVYCASIGRI